MQQPDFDIDGYEEYFTEDYPEDATNEDIFLGESSSATVATVNEITSSFEILESAPPTHIFYSKKQQAHSPNFLRAVTLNIKILKDSLPPGVWIKTYEDRMDLFSLMIAGPRETPYEDGLFIFDIWLPGNFPLEPPMVHYISFSPKRLNPNLYVNGKVCVSLLGTWIAEKDEERWGPKSTLLQVIVSIQGLILVERPAFNEPSITELSGNPVGKKISELYNENVIFGMIHSTTALLATPPLVFKNDILSHFSKRGRKMYKRLKTTLNEMHNPSKPDLSLFLEYIEKIRLT